MIYLTEREKKLERRLSTKAPLKMVCMMVKEP